MEYREPAPRGKYDLVVDINFRMDTSALYSDIVLPTAIWYEKNDLNSTDLHSFIHVLGAAVPPVWESKSDWDIFKTLAKKVSEMSSLAFSEPVRDIVALPLMHDTPDEIAQPQVLDWTEGECEPIPGKTMPHLRVVERDYANIYNKYISLGPRAAKTDRRDRRPHPDEGTTTSCSRARYADPRPTAHALRRVGRQTIPEPRGRARREQHDPDPRRRRTARCPRRRSSTSRSASACR